MIKKKPAAVILSIDPGFDRIGWAVGQMTGNQYHLIDCQCIQTKRSSHIFDRYKEIEAGLKTILEKYSPTQAAVETVFFSKNRKTAMRVSEARGVIIAALLRNGLEVFEYNPGEIKQAVTGYGSADKQAVAKMVRLQTSLTKDKLLDDTVDAVAIGMTHAITSASRQIKAHHKATLNKASTS